MIKKITGILFAAAAVAVIVMTVMHHGQYRSLVFDSGDETIAQTELAAPADATPDDTTPADATPTDAAGQASQNDAPQTPADTTQQEPAGTATGAQQSEQ